MFQKFRIFETMSISIEQEAFFFFIIFIISFFFSPPVTIDPDSLSEPKSPVSEEAQKSGRWKKYISYR